MMIVTISGSLRAASSNTALLDAVARVTPPGVRVESYRALSRLPHFNPDLDVEGAELPEAVVETRTILFSSDAVVISSPEYAHGVPGAVKNMLDWLVSAGELAGKPVALWNASPSGGRFAQASLLETLQTMNWRVIGEASLLEPFLPGRIVGELNDPSSLRRIETAIGALVRAAGAPQVLSSRT